MYCSGGGGGGGGGTVIGHNRKSYTDHCRLTSMTLTPAQYASVMQLQHKHKYLLRGPGPSEEGDNSGFNIPISCNSCLLDRAINIVLSSYLLIGGTEEIS